MKSGLRFVIKFLFELVREFSFITISDEICLHNLRGNSNPSLIRDGNIGKQLWNSPSLLEREQESLTNY
jgi:hypothetical protein